MAARVHDGPGNANCCGLGSVSGPKQQQFAVDDDCPRLVFARMAARQSGGPAGGRR